MRKLPFTKMHALGNNYIYINLFQETLQEDELADLARNLSKVSTGIGSDGMILICPSTVAEVKMRIFNKDGSEAKNCGNGLRSVAKFAYERGIVDHKQFQIETISGIVNAKVVTESAIVQSITIDMGMPQLERRQIPMQGNETDLVISEAFSVDAKTYELTCVSMGNPHAVIFVEDVNDAPVAELGPLIETDPRFPEGVNIEFIEPISANEYKFRVWERGSGITQACGTGACAAAVAAVLNDQASKGEDILIHLEGGDLTINWQENGRVLMTGPASYICDGIYYV